MSRAWLIQLACLYGPLASAALLAFWVRPGKRLATGLLFAFAWNAALLPWFDAFARRMGWWNYHLAAAGIGGMPLALYFGWIIGWGLVAPLLAHALGGRTWMAAALLVAIDLIAMPEMQPVLGLHRFWWPGEMVMAGGLLMPSLWLAKWTAHGERTGLRCAMLVPAFGGVFLGVPLLVELGGMNELADHWRRFAPISRSLIAITAVMLSIPGLAAVRDLARSGHGTPVPLDPPQRLVTHGIYAYLRNPMQLSMTALLLLEAWFVGSFWPLVLAAMGVVYSEGIARWSENRDMWERFGEAWKNYHRSVRPWRPRWLPRAGEPCELWLDDRCGPCSEIAIWFQKRNPIDLKLLRSSQWQGPELNRVTWRHAASNRTETGVAAIAMALQHLNLFWAAVGWTAGLPGICHVLQIYFDAVGAGKRVRANC